MRVVFSRRARADLKEIGDFIARDRPVRARSFTGELIATCRDLALFPEKWPIERAFSDVARRASHGNYLIFYCINPDTIRVEHIVHSARNSWRRDHINV